MEKIMRLTPLEMKELEHADCDLCGKRLRKNQFGIGGHVQLCRNCAKKTIALWLRGF